MAQEFETQILNIDVAAVRAQLRALGAVAEEEVLQKRWVFDIKRAEKIEAESSEWIRLRQSGGKATITYKNKLGSGISDTDEIEIVIDDFEKAAQLLAKLPCLEGAKYQESKREKFILGGIEFFIDTWPMIPPVLEIEGKDEAGVRQGLHLLGLEGKEAGHIGWVKIYSEYGINLHDYSLLKFEI